MEAASPPTQFNGLPPELRQEVWRLALPGPRLISVTRFSKPPLALYINRESRSVALQHYELLSPQHPDDDDGHVEGHTCVKGYIDFEVDIIHIAGLRPCDVVKQKICHLQDNSWLWQYMSETRIFLMTDFVIEKFPRMRSHKTIVHYNPNIQGVEFQGLPTPITEEEFRTRMLSGLDRIYWRIERIKAERAGTKIDWEPPTYEILRCEGEAKGFQCWKPNTCEGILDASISR